jgi:hypothetical protein
MLVAFTSRCLLQAWPQSTPTYPGVVLVTADVMRAAPWLQSASPQHRCILVDSYHGGPLTETQAAQLQSILLAQQGMQSVMRDIYLPFACKLLEGYAHVEPRAGEQIAPAAGPNLAHPQAESSAEPGASVHAASRGAAATPGFFADCSNVSGVDTSTAAAASTSAPAVHHASDSYAAAGGYGTAAGAAPSYHSMRGADIQNAAPAAGRADANTAQLVQDSPFASKLGLPSCLIEDLDLANEKLPPGERVQRLAWRPAPSDSSDRQRHLRVRARRPVQFSAQQCSHAAAVN